MLYSHTTSFLCHSIPEVTVTSHFFEKISVYFLTISFMYRMHCDNVHFNYSLLLLSYLCWLPSSLVVLTPHPTLTCRCFAGSIFMFVVAVVLILAWRQNFIALPSLLIASLSTPSSMIVPLVWDGMISMCSLGLSIQMSALILSQDFDQLWFSAAAVTSCKKKLLWS